MIKIGQENIKKLHQSVVNKDKPTTLRFRILDLINKHILHLLNNNLILFIAFTNKNKKLALASQLSRTEATINTIKEND